MFALAPSILSVILLIMIWLTRERAALLTHVSLPMYLVSDLFINVYRHTHNTSDYYFLTVLNPLIGYAILAIVVLGGGTVIMSTLTPAAKNKGLMPELKAKALFTTPQ